MEIIEIVDNLQKEIKELALQYENKAKETVTPCEHSVCPACVQSRILATLELDGIGKLINAKTEIIALLGGK